MSQAPKAEVAMCLFVPLTSVGTPLYVLVTAVPGTCLPHRASVIGFVGSSGIFVAVFKNVILEVG